MAATDVRPIDRRPTPPRWSPLPLFQQPAVIYLAMMGLALCIDVYLEPPRWIWLALSLIPLVALLHTRARSRQLQWNWLTIGTFVFSATGLSHAYHQRAHRPDNVVHWTDDQWKPLVLRVRLTSQIEHRENEMYSLREGNGSPWSAQVDVDVEAIRVGLEWQQASGRARLIVDDRLDQYLYGDLLRVTCRGARPGAPRNPGAPDYRPAFYSEQQLVRLHADSGDQVHLERAGRWSISRCVAWLTSRGEQALQASVGIEHGPLASAIVLGRRGSIPEPLRDDMVETGTIHLAVVSGLHLSLIAIAVNWITSAVGISLRSRNAVTVGSCVLYSLVTGFRPPVVRALCLVGFVLIGRQSGRRTDAFNLLAAAVITIVLINPAWLSQLGTQLSILAVAALILAQGSGGIASESLSAIDALIAAKRPAWQRLIGRVWRGLRRSAWSSCCVFVLTTPLIWHHFHVISWVSVFANLVISPFLFVGLLSGLVAAIFGCIWEPLGYPWGLLCRYTLIWTHNLAAGLSDLPGSHLWIYGPSGWSIAIFYAGVLLAIGWNVRTRMRNVMLWSCLWTSATLIMYVMAPTYPEQLTVTFIDVGHGTSVLVQPPDSPPWLYDAGRMGSPSQSARPIEAVLWHARVRRLEAIYLSHADSDHYSATSSILRRFACDKIVTTEQMFRHPPPLLADLLKQSLLRRFPLRYVMPANPS